MMKILVGVDNSPESHMALRFTCHLLEHFEASVDALHVKRDVDEIVLADFDIPFLGRRDPSKKIDAEAEKVEKQIESACEVCLAGKVPCEPRVVPGDAAEKLVEEAERGDYDMLVMGSHGASAMKGLLLGAVHSKVLHHVGCPVMIVREMREIRRVLISYRGSRCDQQALHFVAPLLSRQKPEITVLHVQETQLGESGEFAEACLISGDKTLKDYRHAPITKAASGDYVEETLRELISGDYDLVVLGAYGHERPKMIKAISDEALTLVSRTTRPVLVYREKE